MSDGVMSGAMDDVVEGEMDVAALRGELEAARVALSEAEGTIRHLERRQQIDAALVEAEARDMGVARLLTEQAVSEMDEADVQAAVAELKKEKGYLFGGVNGGDEYQSLRPRTGAQARRGGGGSGGVMSARVEGGNREAEVAAERAAVSGDRRDLLRYLRLRRGV